MTSETLERSGKEKLRQKQTNLGYLEENFQEIATIANKDMRFNEEDAILKKLGLYFFLSQISILRL